MKLSHSGGLYSALVLIDLVTLYTGPRYSTGMGNVRAFESCTRHLGV